MWIRNGFFLLVLASDYRQQAEIQSNRILIYWCYIAFLLPNSLLEGKLILFQSPGQGQGYSYPLYSIQVQMS